MKKGLLAAALAALLGGCASAPGAAPQAAGSPAASTAPVPAAAPVWADVRVTEVMASNRSCLTDGDGGFPDWVELYNAGEDVVDLEGWFLSDDELDPTCWSLPTLSIAPGEYALVLCGGEKAWEGLRAPFALSREGESVLLSAPDGRPVSGLRWTELAQDMSAAVTEDGSITHTYLATPGLPNTEEAWLARNAASAIAAPLAINEAMPANFRLLPQLDGECYDWVELQNTSDGALDLAGYYLSDDPDEPLRFRLPAVTLAPGELIVVLCTGGEGVLDGQYAAAPFALNAEAEQLYLSDAQGTLLDRMLLQGVPYGGSYGRAADGAGFVYFAEPTPGRANAAGCPLVAERPTADMAGGVYEDTESLTVALTGEGTVYYTLDCANPLESGSVYTAPLTLTETTVIRAVSVVPGKLTSETACWSYFFNEGHTLPVVSLVSDPESFHGAEGILDFPQREIEQPAAVSFFDGDAGFTADCGITLHGASSRASLHKKSMKLVFRPRYGGALDYDVFGNGVTEYASLLLRSCLEGNVNYLRDEISTQLAMEVSDRVLALDRRYCILYINGEYWGIYSLREAYSQQYAASHLGVSPESVSISRAPARPMAQPELHAVFAELLGEDMADDAVYAYYCDYFDTDSLIDWMILQAFFYNTDLPGNIRYIRSAENGNRWMLALFDTDFAYGLRYASWADVFYAPGQFNSLTRSMIKNADFRHRLLSRMKELFESGLTVERQREILDEQLALLAPELERNQLRWGEAEAGPTVSYLRDCLAADRQQQCIDGLRRLPYFTEAEIDQYFGSA